MIRKMTANTSRRWMSAAVTWNITNAPIHAKNKRSARAKKMNLTMNLPLCRDYIRSDRRRPLKVRQQRREQLRGATKSRADSFRRGRYCAGSFWRVAFTPDKIPSPTSTIASTPIQCGGTCIKCAPYTKPTIKIAYPVAYSPNDMAFPLLPNPRNRNVSIAESPRQAGRVQRHLVDAVRTTSVTGYFQRCTTLARGSRESQKRRPAVVPPPVTRAKKDAKEITWRPRKRKTAFLLTILLSHSDN